MSGANKPVLPCATGKCVLEDGMATLQHPRRKQKATLVSTPVQSNNKPSGCQGSAGTSGLSHSSADSLPRTVGEELCRFSPVRHPRRCLADVRRCVTVGSGDVGDQTLVCPVVKSGRCP